MCNFPELNDPTPLWRPRGGKTHGPVEYVEIDSLDLSTKGLLAFICSWGGRNAL